MRRPQKLKELLETRRHLSEMRATLLLVASHRNRKCILLDRRLRQVERMIADRQKKAAAGEAEGEVI